MKKAAINDRSPFVISVERGPNQPSPIARMQHFLEGLNTRVVWITLGGKAVVLLESVDPKIRCPQGRGWGKLAMGTSVPCACLGDPLTCMWANPRPFT